GMTTDGTVITSIDAGKAHDAANNANNGSTSTDNTVTWKSSRPSVTIDQASGQADPTNSSPINFTVVFSEPVTGFTGSDVSFTGNIYDSGDHQTFEVRVRGMTTAGDVIAKIRGGGITDAAGNVNAASTSLDNKVTWQPAAGNTTPTVTIDSPAFGSVYAKGAT